MATEDFIPARLEPIPDEPAVRGAVDELLASYARWREDALAVKAAYREWSGAACSERRRRHAAYLAALDQETAAGNDYEAVAEELRSSLWPGP
jgi:hypothetical protein